MNTIKRDVYVLKNTIKIPIEITQGTDMIGIEFTVRDFTIPATAAVVAYANHKSMSRLITRMILLQMVWTELQRCKQQGNDDSLKSKTV